MFNKSNPNSGRNFWIAIAIFLAIFGCVGLFTIRNRQSKPAPATAAPATAIVNLQPPTLVQTQVFTPTPLPTVTEPPVATEVPVVVLSNCENHGTVAWHADNKPDGIYAESPIGGLDEPCGIVGQTWWTNENGETERSVFFVPPHTVVWVEGHLGGTGWYFDSTFDVEANLAEQAQQLLERDGEMTTFTVITVEEWKSLPIFSRFMQK